MRVACVIDETGIVGHVVGCLVQVECRDMCFRKVQTEASQGFPNPRLNSAVPPPRNDQVNNRPAVAIECWHSLCEQQTNMAFLKSRHLSLLLALIVLLAYNVLAQSTEKSAAKIDVSALGTAGIEEQIHVSISKTTTQRTWSFY